MRCSLQGCGAHGQSNLLPKVYQQYRYSNSFSFDFMSGWIAWLRIRNSTYGNVTTYHSCSLQTQKCQLWRQVIDMLSHKLQTPTSYHYVKCLSRSIPCTSISLYIHFTCSSSLARGLPGQTERTPRSIWTSTWRLWPFSLLLRPGPAAFHGTRPGESQAGQLRNRRPWPIRSPRQSLKRSRKQGVEGPGIEPEF